MQIVESNFIEKMGPCIVATVSYECCLKFIVDKSHTVPLPYIAKISLSNFLLIM